MKINQTKTGFTIKLSKKEMSIVEAALDFTSEGQAYSEDHGSDTYKDVSKFYDKWCSNKFKAKLRRLGK